MYAIFSSQQPLLLHIGGSSEPNCQSCCVAVCCCCLRFIQTIKHTGTEVIASLFHQAFTHTLSLSHRRNTEKSSTKETLNTLFFLLCLLGPLLGPPAYYGMPRRTHNPLLLASPHTSIHFSSNLSLSGAAKKNLLTIPHHFFPCTKTQQLAIFALQLMGFSSPYNQFLG